MQYTFSALLAHTKRARALAEIMHWNQTDKAGVPYTEHLIRVVDRFTMYRALNLSAMDLQYGVIAAWLHDIVEDTSITIEDLIRFHYPERAVQIVGLMTRDDRPVEQYYADLKADPIGRLVKAADMDDNTNPSRLSLLPMETQERLRAKYAKGYQALDIEPYWP